MAFPVLTSESVIDREKLLDHVDQDTELLHEIADIFLGIFPGQLREIRVAIDRNDSKRVRDIAHSIKGSLSNFFAPAAIAAAKQLEDYGRENQLADAEAAVVQLQQEVQRMSAKLAEICRN